MLRLGLGSTSSPSETRHGPGGVLTSLPTLGILLGCAVEHFTEAAPQPPSGCSPPDFVVRCSEAPYEPLAATIAAVGAASGERYVAQRCSLRPRGDRIVPYVVSSATPSESTELTTIAMPSHAAAVHRAERMSWFPTIWTSRLSSTSSTRCGASKIAFTSWEK
jgi:hypothetical protein